MGWKIKGVEKRLVQTAPLSVPASATQRYKQVDQDRHYCGDFEVIDLAGEYSSGYVVAFLL